MKLEKIEALIRRRKKIIFRVNPFGSKEPERERERNKERKRERERQGDREDRYHQRKLRRK